MCNKIGIFMTSLRNKQKTHVEHYHLVYNIHLNFDLGPKNKENLKEVKEGPEEFEWVG